MALILVLLELGNEKLGFLVLWIVVSDLGCSGGEDCCEFCQRLLVYGCLGRVRWLAV